MTERRSDVLVVGGGPGGSTTATLLARQGYDVVLVERERHPRFHIGESLLPMNLPIFERLGVLEEVAAIGVEKRGADFAASATSEPVRYPFAHALGDSPDHAFQVHRAELDELLFRHAGRAGVETHEGIAIHRLSVDEDGVTAQGRNEERKACTFRARFLVDASGRASLGARQLGVDILEPRHKSAAVFGHFRDVAMPEDDADAAGNIVVHRIDRGWLWLIPLTRGVTSVGLVAEPQVIAAGRPEAILREHLGTVPSLAARLEGAELVEPVRSANNYAYRCATIGGPRWLMVGDAYAFLDPVFSSGVYLAMKSAELASDVVDEALRNPARERRAREAYERQVRGAYDAFGWFIRRFTNDGIALLFHQPKNEYQIVQGLISMLAGDIFDQPEVHRRLLAFKIVYLYTRLDIWRIQAWDALTGKRRWRDLLEAAYVRTFAP